MNQDSFDSTVSDFGSLTEQTLDEVARSHSYTGVSHGVFRNSLNTYRAALKHLYGIIKAKHRKKATGNLICRLLSERIDRLILHIFRNVASESECRSDFAVAALGGYGRVELNPFSDVDLLFLSREPFNEYQNRVIETIIHFLWDMNLDIGHSTRTIDECFEAAEDDTYLATSLIEARLLAGNADIWRDFQGRYSDWLGGGAGRQLAMQKIEERIRRLEFYHGTVHIQEPNVKECPGALRDIHTARWLLLLTEQGQGLSAMFNNASFSESERDVYEGGLDFLLRVRNTLHFHAGKKADILDHTSLPDAAKELGYRGAGVKPVERFMRDYYMHVGRIRSLTDRIVSDFMARFSRDEAEPFVPVSDGIIADNTAVALAGEDSGALTVKPGRLVEIFAVAGERKIKLTRKTSSRIEKNSSLYDKELPENPEVRAAFQALINKHEGVAHALQLMREHGVLTKVIPEFEAISWHYQYDFYHRYTTDEHSLRVVQNLENMSAGKGAVDSELVSLMQDVTARSALYLAGLLHDVGKGGGNGHARRGERMAARALKRLGFDGRTIHLVRFLIREHLLMSHISQRRDMDDEDTINDFIERVNSAGRLRMLTLLTFADLMALSENALTDWKKALLWNLYRKGLMLIDRDFESTVHKTQKNKIRQVLKTLAPSFSQSHIRSHIDNLPEHYIRDASPADIRSHIKGIEHMKKRGAWASFQRKGELSRLTVIAPDHPRALSDICGAITSSDISIVRAQIFTRNDGVIIDTFHVVGGKGEALIAPESQREFKKCLPKIFTGTLDVRALIASHIHRWKRRKKNVVYYPPRVKFHNDISSKHTVVDVFAADYTGLLYDITSVLADNGIDIHTARIGTDEDQVADAFYIWKGGRKIEDEETIGKLTAEIIARLTEAYR